MLLKSEGFLLIWSTDFTLVSWHCSCAILVQDTYDTLNKNANDILHIVIITVLIQNLLWHTFPLFCFYQCETITNKDLRGPFQNPPYCTLPCRSLDEFLVSHRYCVKYWLLRSRYRGQRNGVGCIVTVTEASNIVWVTSLLLLRHKKCTGYFVPVINCR
jgi:hypothetical protein